MDFISENIIEKVAEEIGASEENFSDALQNLHEEQPILAAYIFSENFDLLTQAEKEYFLFLFLVLYFSIKKENELALETIDEETISKTEENNWTMLSEVKAKKFRERMDVFFKDYPQEDLLAFVEDALTGDEEEIVTKVGREPMFVALKSMIDCFCL